MTGLADELHELTLDVEMSAIPIVLELVPKPLIYLYLIALPLSAPLIVKLPNNILSIPALLPKTLLYCPLSLLNLLIALCIGCFNLEKLTQSRRVAPAFADPLIISNREYSDLKI